MCSHSSDKESLLVCKVLLGHRYGGGGNVKWGVLWLWKTSDPTDFCGGREKALGSLGWVLGAPQPLWGAAEPAVHRAGALHMSHL